MSSSRPLRGRRAEPAPATDTAGEVVLVFGDRLVLGDDDGTLFLTTTCESITRPASSTS